MKKLTDKKERNTEILEIIMNKENKLHSII